jgi:hypothetical protein
MWVSRCNMANSWVGSGFNQASSSATGEGQPCPPLKRSLGSIELKRTSCILCTKIELPPTQFATFSSEMIAGRVAAPLRGMKCRCVAASRTTLASCAAKCIERQAQLRAGREERYRPNGLLLLISYQHHQCWIVVAILLPQALDCTLRAGKCRRFVWQKCTVGIALCSPSGHRMAKKYRGTATSSHPLTDREASYSQIMKVSCPSCRISS